jgi:lipoprotein-anchoring transpeptidase ErfK/SrfK
MRRSSFRRTVVGLLLSHVVTVAALGLVGGIVGTVVATTAAPALATPRESIQKYKKSSQRWIEVDVTRQRLIAWEGKTWVEAFIVSTGKSSTPTPIGTYSIYTKQATARMQGDGYDISDVPHVMYFTGGFGFHGAYWHNSFGTPVSHGCVNLAPSKARWLFNWAPMGTPVVIHD